MKCPKKIKVRIVADGSVERNHKEMMKYLNVTYKTYGWLCGQKVKILYVRLRAWRRLRRSLTYVGKCVFWNVEGKIHRDVYYVQETIGGWRQNAVFSGTYAECIDWLGANPMTSYGSWNIVHENEYEVDYL